MSLCQIRTRQGDACELPGADYGITIQSPAFHRMYTVMACHKHWMEYLKDPGKLITNHELGCMQWLQKEVEPLAKDGSD